MNVMETQNSKQIQTIWKKHQEKILHQKQYNCQNPQCNNATTITTPLPQH